MFMSINYYYFLNFFPAEKYSFPREEKHRKNGEQDGFRHQELPSDDEIDDTLQRAWISAVLLCLSLNLKVPDVSKPSRHIILKDMAQDQQVENEKENENEDVVKNTNQGIYKTNSMDT